MSDDFEFQPLVGTPAAYNTSIRIMPYGNQVIHCGMVHAHYGGGKEFFGVVINPEALFVEDIGGSRGNRNHAFYYVAKHIVTIKNTIFPSEIVDCYGAVTEDRSSMRALDVFALRDELAKGLDLDYSNEVIELDNLYETWKKAVTHPFIWKEDIGYYHSPVEVPSDYKIGGNPYPNSKKKVKTHLEEPPSEQHHEQFQEEHLDRSHEQPREPRVEPKTQGSKRYPLRLSTAEQILNVFLEGPVSIPEVCMRTGRSDKTVRDVMRAFENEYEFRKVNLVATTRRDLA